MHLAPGFQAQATFHSDEAKTVEERDELPDPHETDEPEQELDADSSEPENEASDENEITEQEESDKKEEKGGKTIKEDAKETNSSDTGDKEVKSIKDQVSMQGKKQKIHTIKSNTRYTYSLNERVSIQFHTLQDIESPYLTIEETSVEVNKKKVTGYAFETNMKNKTFSYDLTLPKSQNSEHAEVHYSEDGEVFTKVKNTKEEGDSVTIKNLDHFTIFVVTTPDPVQADCTGAGIGIVGSDSCYNTIQEAVDNAAEGDTIEVQAGTYNETVLISTNNIILRGNGGDANVAGADGSVIIDGSGITSGPNGRPSAISFTEGVSGVTIEGFHIRNFRDTVTNSPGRGAGIDSWDVNTSNITITNNTFTNIDWAAVFTGSNDGATGTDGWVVTQNDVQMGTWSPNNNVYGIEMTNATNAVVAENMVSGGYQGVLISSQNAAVQNVEVRNNAISETEVSNIYVYGDNVTDVAIEDNTFGEAPFNDWMYAGGVTTDNNTWIVGGSTGYTTPNQAINHARDGDTILVTPGTYTNPADPDVFINKSVDLTCEYGAIIEGTGNGTGIRIQADNVTVSGCSITDFLYGIIVSSNVANPDTIRVQNSRIYDNASLGIRNDSTLGGNVDARGNWWGSPTGPNDTQAGDGSIPDTNPAGTGNGVRGMITYEGWMGGPIPAPENLGFNVPAGDYATPRPDVEVTCGGYVNQNLISHHWTSVTGAVRYQRQWQYPGSSTWQGAENWTTPYSNYRTLGGNPGVEGEWTFRVRAQDADGNWSGWSDTCLLNYDRTAPEPVQMTALYQGHDAASRQEVLTCTTDSTGYTTDTRITIDWEPSTDPNIDFYWLGTKTNPRHARVQHPTTEYLGNMSPGRNPYWYTIIAVDKAGNESALTSVDADTDKSTVSEACGNLILDTEDPEAPVWTNPTAPVFVTRLGDGAQEGRVNMTFQGSPSTDVAFYEYQYRSADLNGANPSSNIMRMNGASCNAGNICIWTPMFNDGRRNIHRVRAVDNAGNRSEWSNYTNLNETEFSNVNPDDFYYDDYVNGTGVFTTANGYVQARGGFGVREQISPESTITSTAPASPVQTSTIALEYTSNDVDTAVKEVRLYVSYDGGGYSQVDASTETEGTFNYAMDQGDGEYCFHTRAEDIADDLILDNGTGNIEPAKACAYEVTLDTTAPVVSIGSGNNGADGTRENSASLPEPRDNEPQNSGPAHGSTVNGTVSVHGTATDENMYRYHFRIIADGETEAGKNAGTNGFNQGGYVYTEVVYSDLGPDGQIDFDNNTDGIQGLDTTLLEDGCYWMIIGARDEANNRSDSNRDRDPRVRICIDNTPPMLTLTPITIPEGEEIPDFVEFIDSVSGNDGNEPVCTFDPANPSNTVAQPEAEQVYEVVCTVSDTVGNSVEERTTLTIENNIPSVTIIDAGNNLNTDVINGNPDFTYEWGGDCAGTGSTVNKATEPGSYTCTVTVRDSDGDTATDSISYTIAPAPGNDDDGQDDNDTPQNSGGSNPDNNDSGTGSGNTIDSGFIGGIGNDFPLAQNDTVTLPAPDEDEEETEEDEEGEILGIETRVELIDNYYEIEAEQGTEISLDGGNGLCEQFHNLSFRTKNNIDGRVYILDYDPEKYENRPYEDARYAFDVCEVKLENMSFEDIEDVELRSKYTENWLGEIEYEDGDLRLFTANTTEEKLDTKVSISKVEDIRVDGKEYDVVESKMDALPVVFAIAPVELSSAEAASSFPWWVILLIIAAILLLALIYFLTRKKDTKEETRY
ncbi:MAG: hypothetical protein ACOCXT_01465 [Candidatus Dojkabacteria bacterium]